MSVIDNALKAAQREKILREEQSGAARHFSPVLVRLRTQPKLGVRREYLLGGAALITVAFAVFLWLRIRSDAALPAIPPVTSTILSEALSSDRSATESPVVQQAAGLAPAPADTASLPSPSAAIARATRSDHDDATRTADPGPHTAAPAENVVESDRPPEDERSRIEFQPRRAGTLRISMAPPRQDDAARLFSEAIAAHRAQDYPRAKQLYQQVLFFAPNDADALNNLAVLLSAERQFDRALELLRRASVAAPRNAGVWNNIGSALREQGHGDEAVAAFRKALTIDPRHQGARVGLAQHYIASNALDAAAETLQGVVGDYPDLAEAHYTLGQVRELSGDVAGAIASYTAFVRLAPDRLASHVELVRRRVEALSSR